MPMIIYDIPFIGASNQDRKYAQKGPTCWYYATKMLFKFHELLNGRTDQLYRSWKALSELRKVLTEVGTKNIKQVLSGGSYHADSLLPLLTKSNLNVQKDLSSQRLQMEQFKKKVEQLSREAKPLTGDMKKMLGQTLATYGQRIEKLTGRTSAVAEAFQHVTKIRKECLKGSRFVTLFFSPPAFIAVPVPDGKSKWQRTEMELYKVLSNYGPVYAAGDLGWASTTWRGSNLEVTDIGGHEYGHAVAVVGVNTYQKKVYYKDPNASSSICIIDFEKFIQKVRPEPIGSESSLFAAVKCSKFDSHGVDYCDHVRLGKKKTAHLSKKVREEEEMWEGLEWSSFEEEKAPLMLEWKKDKE